MPKSEKKSTKEDHKRKHEDNGSENQDDVLANIMEFIEQSAEQNKKTAKYVSQLSAILAKREEMQEAHDNKILSLIEKVAQTQTDHPSTSTTVSKSKKSHKKQLISENQEDNTDLNIDQAVKGAGLKRQIKDVLNREQRGFEDFLKENDDQVAKKLLEYIVGSYDNSHNRLIITERSSGKKLHQKKVYWVGHKSSNNKAIPIMDGYYILCNAEDVDGLCENCVNEITRKVLKPKSKASGDQCLHIEKYQFDVSDNHKSKKSKKSKKVVKDEVESDNEEPVKVPEEVYNHIKEKVKQNIKKEPKDDSIPMLEKIKEEPIPPELTQDIKEEPVSEQDDERTNWILEGKISTPNGNAIIIRSKRSTKVKPDELNKDTTNHFKIFMELPGKQIPFDLIKATQRISCKTKTESYLDENNKKISCNPTTAYYFKSETCKAIHKAHKELFPEFK